MGCMLIITLWIVLQKKNKSEGKMKNVERSGALRNEDHYNVRCETSDRLTKYQEILVNWQKNIAYF